jgi:hypothetical protein
MKVTVLKTPESFRPVDIVITLHSIDDLRALRRLTGSLPHSEIYKAIESSNVKGPTGDAEIIRNMSTRIYSITKDLYDKYRPKGGCA